MTRSSLRSRPVLCSSSLVIGGFASCLIACSSVDPSEVGASGDAISNPANQTAYDFFVSKGLTSYQAAGIVGNLDQESNVDPTISQSGGGVGRGIAQWSAGGRWDTDSKDNVVWYASEEGESAYSLTLQLQFIWYELETFPNYGLAALRNSTNVTAATIAFETDFEGCGTCDQSTRVAYAEAALSAYAGTTVSAPSPGGSAPSSAGCYSTTLAAEAAANACVETAANTWVQCDDGAWVDRWMDPTACSGVFPLESGTSGGCYSGTLGREMPDNACVQSRSDDAWYQCNDGAWDDRWTDPATCDGTYPL